MLSERSVRRATAKGKAMTVVGVPPDLHRAAARMFPSGVTVATAAHGDHAHAITATAFCSLSLDPPLVLLAVDRNGQLLDLVRRAGHFGVSVLSDRQQRIGAWASTRGRVPRRTLDPHDTVTARTGAPLIPGAAAWFDCTLRSITEHGDHVVLIGLVVDAGTEKGASPLVYFQGGYHTLGTRIAEGGIPTGPPDQAG